MVRRCTHLMVSYKDTQIYCCRKFGHKGHCKINPSDKWRETEALMNFMKRAINSVK